MTNDTTARIAEAILAGFDRHYRIFREISREAKTRFEASDWAAVQRASQDRIGFYDQRVREGVASVLSRFPEAKSEVLWRGVKRSYIPLLYEHQQPECAETFYNSVACRVLHRTYYRNEYIFWRPAISTEHIPTSQPTLRCYYPAESGWRPTLEAVVRDYELARPWEDLDRDLGLLVDELRRRFPDPGPDVQIQVLRSLFFRNQAAYVVGRLATQSREFPFAIAIRQTPRRDLHVDALLTRPEDIGQLFSLGRAYFMVDMEVPSAYVRFLKQLMPTKSDAELYTALGLQKQGKTLFYRDLHAHLQNSRDRFVVAPGTRGMVMVVFTLPSFPYVFKLIRDRFEPPKDSSREKVKAQYLRVKLHDRVGRMADTLEFTDVALPLDRFDPALLAVLGDLTKETVSFEDGKVVLGHVYIERRLTPLDVFLAGADEHRARQAIADYGRAIKELAAANIFPGDLLLKNFGLTRYGRAVFYDYDEISLLTEVKFRFLPRARDDDEETAGEPWYSVGPEDVFPEQFPTVLFRDERQRQMFVETHPELTDPRYYAAQQERLRAGQFDPLFPYPDERRFSRRRASRPPNS